MTRCVRGLFTLVIGIGLLAVTPAVAEDEEPTARDLKKAERFKPAGSIRIEATSIAVGVGFTWGKGTFSFEGQDHRFSVKGLELIGIGFTKVVATGTVFNLERIEDFPGTYGGAGAGAALKDGKGGVSVRKGGVYITLSSTQKGAELSAGGGGLTIKLLDPQ